MNDDAIIYLHIGLPKTGTTYLQKQVFPYLYSLDYLHKPLSNFLKDGSDSMYGIIDRAFKHSAVIWEELGDDIFSHLTDDARGASTEQRGVNTGQRSLLISDEGIGTGGSQPFSLRTHLEKFSAKASDWGFTSLKIICVFRRQDQWLGSHYAQVSDRNPYASQDDFEAFVDAWLDKRRQYYSKGILLDYKILRDQLVSAVGKNNVLMLPFERLQADATAYLSRILEFLEANEGKTIATLNGLSGITSNGVKPNARSLSKNVWAIRDRTFTDAKTIRLRPGRFFSALGLPTQLPLHWPEFGREKSIQVTDDLKEKVLDVYAQSNRDLAADLHMDLEQYGYY